MEKFTSDELKGMMKEEALSSLPPNVEFGQTADGKLMVNGRVIPYGELKQRDDAWYEKRARFWAESKNYLGETIISIFPSLSKFDGISGIKWRGCFIPKTGTAIGFGGASSELTRDMVIDCVKRGFKNLIETYPNGTDNFRFRGHQSEDIREAIDAEGPWTESDGVVNQPGERGVVGEKWSCCGAPEGTAGPSQETVKPETIDAIVAMYEDKILAITAQYELGIQDSHRIIQSQQGIISYLSSKLESIKDALDGKPEGAAQVERSSSDPITNAIEQAGDGFESHDSNVLDAMEFQHPVYPRDDQMIETRRQSMAYVDEKAYRPDGTGLVGGFGQKCAPPGGVKYPPAISAESHMAFCASSAPPFSHIP